MQVVFDKLESLCSVCLFSISITISPFTKDSNMTNRVGFNCLKPNKI